MNKYILILFLLLVANVRLLGAELKFRNNKFKIVQFTDLHIRLNDTRSDIAFERISQVLDDEKPDLVIVTGDLIYNSPADENLKRILSVFESREQPFAVIFGNHDQEQGFTNEQLFNEINKFKFNKTRDVDGVSGVGNCALTIQSSDSDLPSAVLYLIDSGRDSDLPQAEGYAFIRFDQIDWYRKTSESFTRKHGSPLPSLAFFHIPIPEFGYAVADSKVSMYGIRREVACSSTLNSGLFCSMKEMGDVMGVFVGHDHDNDYALNYKGILLAYGRFTGGPTEYTHIPNGARVIELSEGSREFRTWIRSVGGIEQNTIFPKDYMK